MVVGDVQSGKTSHYTGLITKAIDSGYKLIIVFSGIYNALRAQTQQRIEENTIKTTQQGEVVNKVFFATAKPDYIIQIGDWASFDSLSYFQKNSTQAGKLKDAYMVDIESMRRSIDLLDKHINNDRIPRHVTFGINYLTDFVQTLSEEEQMDRAKFALEACTVSRNRLKAYEVWNKYGLNIEETEEYEKGHVFQTQFQDVLFSRIMPNLKKIGLLRDELIPEYEKLGVMSYAEGDSDYETSWEELSKPLKEAV
mgnify:CR=1 FL=1